MTKPTGSLRVRQMGGLLRYDDRERFHLNIAPPCACGFVRPASKGTKAICANTAESTEPRRGFNASPHGWCNVPNDTRSAEISSRRRHQRPVFQNLTTG